MIDKTVASSQLQLFLITFKALHYWKNNQMNLKFVWFIYSFCKHYSVFMKYDIKRNNALQKLPWAESYKNIATKILKPNHSMSLPYHVWAALSMKGTWKWRGIWQFVAKLTNTIVESMF